MSKRAFLTLLACALPGMAAVHAQSGSGARGLSGFRRGDNLHPVEGGYEIWASAVAPTLESWVK